MRCVARGWLCRPVVGVRHRLVRAGARLFDVRSSRSAWPVAGSSTVHVDASMRAPEVAPRSGSGLAPRLGSRVGAGILADTGGRRAAAGPSAAGREAFASRPSGSNLRRAVAARKRAPRASRRPLARSWPTSDRVRLASSSFARASPVPSWNHAPRARAFESVGSRSGPGPPWLFRARIAPRPRSATLGAPEGAPSVRGASVSEVGLRSPPGEIPHRNPCAGAIESLRWPPSSVCRASSVRSEDRPERLLRFVARCSFVKSGHRAT